MVKTNEPGRVRIAGKTIKTNALPDPFDALDLIYRPKLQLLPDQKDQRAGQVVLDQIGESCTGQAVAGLVDTVLSEPPPQKTPEHGPPRKPTTRVSPYMLYAMARKYDEFPGQEDVGSSLRGAFKGWYHHGVCSEETWPAGLETRDLYQRKFVAECRKTPLGAYYRVNARRIDDMQSAITELGAIAASAAIHTGWRTPRKSTHGSIEKWIIREGNDQMGGHAFLIAGYDDVGFLVQNSWGTTWGRNGYATLPYDDWLDNGYDAWVARPGVPQVGFAERRRVVVPAGTSLAAATGPNVARLKVFVVNVTAGGRMSKTGDVSSDPAQLEGLAAAMETQQNTWVTEGDPKRRLVLYAHGGLVGEAGGIAVADRMIDWWRANHIYPVHIVWESDALTTIFSFLEHLREVLPFGGLRDGWWEALDTMLEGAGRNIRSLWQEMKVNARAASGDLKGAPTPAADEPGVTLFVQHLKAYRQRHPDLEVHLVGHSAGSVVLGAVIKRLIAEGIQVESLQLMGAAIRVDEFVEKVVSELRGAPGGSGMLRRFTAYDLTDKSELDDTCPGPPVPIYHKSLLYFVARSLEESTGNFEVPMVGLSKAVPKAYPMPDGSSRPLIDVIGGSANLVIAPNSATEADSRSKANGHGEFDDDPDTMTSVVMRIKGTKNIKLVTPYPKGGMPTGR